MRTAFACLMVAVLASCDSGASTLAPGSPKLRVLNRTQTAVCEMYIWPEGTFVRGDNLLDGSSGPLRPGASESVRIDGGSNNVELRDCGGGWVLNGRGIDVRGPTELVFYSGSPPGGLPPEGYRRVEIGMDSTGAEKRPNPNR